MRFLLNKIFQKVIFNSNEFGLKGGVVGTGLFLVLSTVGNAAVHLAFASETGFSPSPLALTGRIFSDLYFPTRDLHRGKVLQISNSLWLQGNPRVTENGYAHFTLTATEFESSGVTDHTGFSPGIREGFLDFSKDGWGLRVGKMLIPWGKSDGINPTDFLTAKDFTFFNPDEEVRRIGAVGVFGSWTPNQGNSPWTLNVVSTPVFPRSKLLLQSTALPSRVTLASDENLPDPSLANFESAFKVNYAGEQWDFSWSIFSGWNHLPEFEVKSIQVSGTPTSPVVSTTLDLTYHRYRAIGTDTSFTSGQWVFRGESADVWTENDNGSDSLIQPSHWDTVLGIERSIWEDFRVQGQWVTRYYPRYKFPSQTSGQDAVQTAVYQQVASLNALIQGYQESFRPSATLRVAYSNDLRGMAAEILIYYNFVGKDFLLRPSFNTLLTESLRLITGVDYYGGSTDRPLGRLAEFNSLFLEAKYTF